MNVALLIKKYFSSPMSDVTIDVFDKKNINNVFRQIISVLTQHISIETTLLQAMSYCFYEILDNVLIHSGKENGTVITHYSQQEHMLSFLIADDGKGIKSSLSENSKYASIEESEALKICVEDSVTDGKGMGFGLYSASRLAHNVGLRFDVRSGNHTLRITEKTPVLSKSDFWQGTIVYMQLRTNIEIDPSDVVAKRTDPASQFNEEFLDDEEIQELW